MKKVRINGKHHRSAEAAVWNLVSGLLKDPVRAELDEMFEQE